MNFCRYVPESGGSALPGDPAIIGRNVHVQANPGLYLIGLFGEFKCDGCHEQPGYRSTWASRKHFKCSKCTRRNPAGSDSRYEHLPFKPSQFADPDAIAPNAVEHCVSRAGQTDSGSEPRSV